MYLKQCLPCNSFDCFISFGIVCIMLFNVVHARDLNLWRHFSVNQRQKASLQMVFGTLQGSETSGPACTANRPRTSADHYSYCQAIHPS